MSNNGPPEINQLSVTVILPSVCKIMFCVILKSYSGLLQRLNFLINCLMALSSFYILIKYFYFRL